MNKEEHEQSMETDIKYIRDGVSSISALAKGSFVAAGLYIAVSLFSGESTPGDIRKERNELYQSALAIHADTNRDNIVSELEEKTFITNLLKEKNAVFVKNWPIYKTGESVPIDTVEEWVNSYDSGR